MSTSAPFTFVEAAVRVSGDAHLFVVPVGPTEADLVFRAVLTARGALTTSDGRDSIHASTIDPDSIRVHPKLDTNKRGAYPLFTVDGQDIPVESRW